MKNILWVKIGRRIAAIDPASILYIEGDKFSCNLHFSDEDKFHTRKVIRTPVNISVLENLLRSHGHLRCHRNFIINPSILEICYDSGSHLSIMNQLIPVSRRKRKLVSEMIGV